MEESNRIVIKEVDPGFDTSVKSRLYVYKQPNNLYALYFKDGGNLPLSLMGSYTGVADAERAGISYLCDKFRLSVQKIKAAEKRKNTEIIKKAKAKKVKAAKDK